MNIIEMNTIHEVSSTGIDITRVVRTGETHRKYTDTIYCVTNVTRGGITWTVY